MAVFYKLPSGTRASLDGLAASDSLTPGQCYHITDEGNLALASAVDAYTTFVQALGITAIRRLTQTEYDAIGTPDATTLYLVTEA